MYIINADMYKFKHRPYNIKGTFSIKYLENN